MAAEKTVPRQCLRPMIPASDRVEPLPASKTYSAGETKLPEKYREPEERTSMRSLRPILTAALFSFAFQGFAGSAEATEPIGMLRCNVSGGVGFVITSDKALACIFRPEHGKTEYYVGTIRRFGLDIGVTGPGRLAWGVSARAPWPITIPWRVNMSGLRPNSPSAPASAPMPSSAAMTGRSSCSPCRSMPRRASISPPASAI